MCSRDSLIEKYFYFFGEQIKIKQIKPNYPLTTFIRTNIKYENKNKSVQKNIPPDGYGDIYDSKIKCCVDEKVYNTTPHVVVP